MAERIIKDAQDRADAANEKTAQTVEVYNDTVRKLALLKRNIAKTISEDELNQADITVLEVKEPEVNPAPSSKTEEAAPQPATPQQEPVKAEAKAEPAAGNWGQVANSRAAQAAERLRKRTGKG